MAKMLTTPSAESRLTPLLVRAPVAQVPPPLAAPVQAAPLQTAQADATVPLPTNRANITRLFPPYIPVPGVRGADITTVHVPSHPPPNVPGADITASGVPYTGPPEELTHSMPLNVQDGVHAQDDVQAVGDNNPMTVNIQDGRGDDDGVRRSDDGVHPGEVAFVVPETQVTVDLESGREKRAIIGDDLEIPLYVSKWVERPSPQRALIGPHVDILTDERGELEESQPKRTAHHTRTRDLPPAARLKSDGSPRVQARSGRPPGPRAPAEIRRFSKQARRR